MPIFDWHGEPLSRTTPLTASYRMTQNVRRFLRTQCGEDFKFDRAFMAWVKSGAPQNPPPKTLGDIADEWQKRHNL